jgi:GTPase
VLDASSLSIPQHLDTITAVLLEVFKARKGKADALDTPILLVFNKADLLAPARLRELKKQYPEAMFVSALTGANLAELTKKIHELLKGSGQAISYVIPLDQTGLLAKHFSYLKILKQSWTREHTKVDALVARPIDELEPFAVRAKRGKA